MEPGHPGHADALLDPTGILDGYPIAPERLFALEGRRLMQKLSQGGIQTSGSVIPNPPHHLLGEHLETGSDPRARGAGQLDIPSRQFRGMSSARLNLQLHNGSEPPVRSGQRRPPQSAQSLGMVIQLPPAIFQILFLALKVFLERPPFTG